MSSKPIYIDVYIEHVVFWIVHDMRRQSVEREKISHLCPLLTINHLGLTHDIGVYDLVSGKEVVFHIFFGIMELHHEFSEYFHCYSSPSLRSLVTPNTSCLFMGLSSMVNSSAILYNFLTIGKVWF